MGMSWLRSLCVYCLGTPYDSVIRKKGLPNTVNQIKVGIWNNVKFTLIDSLGELLWKNTFRKSEWQRIEFFYRSKGLF